MNVDNILTAERLKVLNKLCDLSVDQSHERLTTGDFKYRSCLNARQSQLNPTTWGGTWNYGEHNRLVGVFAFRLQDARRYSRVIDTELIPFNSSVDVTVDILTIRTQDLTEMSLKDFSSAKKRDNFLFKVVIII